MVTKEAPRSFPPIEAGWEQADPRERDDTPVTATSSAEGPSRAPVRRTSRAPGALFVVSNAVLCFRFELPDLLRHLVGVSPKTTAPFGPPVLPEARVNVPGVSR